MTGGPILICFAVKEEAKFFVQPHGMTKVAQIVTGMGQRNAVNAVRPLLETLKPALVITSGFAGALKPELKLGTVVYEAEAGSEIEAWLRQTQAVPVKFYCAEKVAVTAAQKRALYNEIHADVVEMESTAIRELCKARGIPSATVRVISDEADEDLPLDFNVLMTAGEKIDFVKLAGTIVRHPKKIPPLMRFQKRTVFAARQLGNVLEELVGARGN